MKLELQPTLDIRHWYSLGFKAADNARCAEEVYSTSISLLPNDILGLFAVYDIMAGYAGCCCKMEREIRKKLKGN